MAIPDFQTLMLPLLKITAKGELGISESVERLAKEFQLTELETLMMIPSGADYTFRNRVRWSKTYLGKAGLLEPTRRGYFRITDRGRKILDRNPKRIDIKFLSQFDEFKDFRWAEKGSGETTESENVARVVQSATQSPDELIRGIHQEIQNTLRKELLDRILGSSPSFFEKVIVSLLLGMGYGGSRDDAGRAIGKSGDGGLDGVIEKTLSGSIEYTFRQSGISLIIR